ncbi:LmeA family phospholipid-binding protein [Corynebacterium caspium]|uniref:LmeA family phospholipid-binding protein n=1 Tax=Corynebacterium caspium TaxID=234828 RepID=UPI00038135D0|nr:LmeA family phospholipid-binding protein [Corynebacterium caspium]WKD59927.1 hypothetical protein CCASP_07760 [Corynebacterium caspium DSM 44850]
MKTLRKIILSLFIVIVLAGFAAEAGIRWATNRALEAEFSTSAGAGDAGEAAAKPEISFGRSSILLSAITGNIPLITVKTPSTLQFNTTASGITEVSGNPAAQVRIENLKMPRNQAAVAGHITIISEAPTQYLLAVTQKQLADSLGDNIFSQLLQITKLTPNPATGTLAAEFSSGAAELVLKPAVVAGQSTFEVVETRLFGFTLSEAVSAGISSAFASGVNERIADNKGLQVESLEVTANGLLITATGTNVQLSELETISGAANAGAAAGAEAAAGVTAAKPIAATL